MARGGSIQEVSIGGRTFAVAADADTTRKLGGKEVELEMNGNATARVIETTVGWSITGIMVSVDETNADQDFLQDCADGTDAGDDGFYPCVITYAGGTSRMGRGRPIGAVEAGSMKATCSLSLGGPGKLEQQ